MMKRLKILQKKPVKNLKYKKTKATKEDKENNERNNREHLPKQKWYKRNPRRVKKSIRHNQDNEYTDNDAEYVDETEDLIQQRRSIFRKKNSLRYKQDDEYNDNDYEYRDKTEDITNLRQYEYIPSKIKKSSKYKRDDEYNDYEEENGRKREDIAQQKKYENVPSRIKKSLQHHRDNEYIDYNDENGDEMEDITQQKKYEKVPSRIKKSSQYHRDNTYNDYNDEFGGKTYDFIKQKKYEQIPSRNKKSPRYNREHECTDNYDEYGGETTDLPHRKQYKRSPLRKNNSSRYDGEYTDYDDEYGGNRYNSNYKKVMDDSGDEILAYMTEDTSKYRRNPGGMREYYSTADTEYLEDSDSDCSTCNSRRGYRSDYTSENPSQHLPEGKLASRHMNMHRQGLRKRKVVPSQMEIKRSPYWQTTKNRSGNKIRYPEEYEEDFENTYSPYHSHFGEDDRENPYHRNPHEVYVTRAPDGHKVFTHKHQLEPNEQTSESGSEMSVDDEEEEQEEGMEELRWRKNQSRYQVFAANTEDNRGVFQKQPRQNPRETLLSVTEYDSTVPMVALASTRANKSPDISQSIVYLPVVVKDDTLKLRHSKVVHAESILKTIGERAEKPLETDMNVYLQTENGQGNIFQQAQRNVEQEITTPQNVQVYTTQSNHSLPLDKKPSAISKVASMVGLNKKSKDKSDYPVQKSYINVAPSKTKPIEQKGSKISIKSGTSKMYVNKKGNKNKRKIESEETESQILSVINPTTSIDNRSDEHSRNNITSTGGDMVKQKTTRQTANQTLKSKSTIEIDNTNAPSTYLTKKSTFDSHGPLLKQPTLEKCGGGENSTKNISNKKQCSKDRQCSKEKNSIIITIKDDTNGQYQELKTGFDGNETDLQHQINGSEAGLLKKKGFESTHKKESKTKSDPSKHLTTKQEPTNYDPYTFNPDEYSSPTLSLTAEQNKKSKGDVPKAKKSPSGKNIQTKRSHVEFSNKTDQYQIWKVLSFDSYAFKYIYQVMEYFLGLSIHATLMEVLRNAKQSD